MAPEVATENAASLVTIKAKTRGKSTRDVEYQGVGKFVKEKETVKEKDSTGKMVEKEVEVERLVTQGVITDIKTALGIEAGNMQSLLDNWAVGFNLNAYKAVSDALSEYIKPSWSDANVAAFRLAVNNLLKLDIDIEQAVAVASSKLPA